MQKNRPRTPDDVENAKAEALTKDFVLCVQRLGISPQDAAMILGVPAGAFAAMKAGKRAVDGVSGEAEAADALVRVTKRLHKLLGESESAWRSWLRRDNSELEAKPLDLMKQRRGVIKVAGFLEGKGEL